MNSPDRESASSQAADEVGFADLALSEVMLKSLANAEYLEPTPIQSGLIPRALTGVDVIGQAQTGTGKTASFVIPILERIEIKRGPANPQALILVPTRELAVQVRDETVKLSHGQRARSVALYGGKPVRGQSDKLQRGTEIVVGTPGRVLDHIGRRTLVLHDLKVIVLDEADRMLDIGFRPDIERILKQCPRERQTLLLSATVPSSVRRLAQRYMQNPESLDFSPKDIGVETIEQFYFSVENERKFELLVRLLERESPTQAIIFCRTKRGTERIHNQLKKKFKGVECMHGDLTQSARDRTMQKFREAGVRYLVATDVVGRGIDVSGISHIINFNVPEFCDDYVHRVGRTGRMGREGVAFTFVTPDEGGQLTRIEVRINKLLKRAHLEGFDPVPLRPQTADGEPPAEEEKEKPKPSSLSGRRRRRHRRAL